MNKKIIASSAAAVAALSACASLPLFVKPPEKKIKSEHGRDWMSVLNDSTPVSHIAIPGTHDSATENIYFASIAKCQHLSVLQQLEAGIRFLDIRLRIKNGKLIAVHGSTKCFSVQNGKVTDLTFESILDSVYSFLKTNKGETVLISIKNEGKDFDYNFEKILYSEYLNPASRFWFLENRIPKLSEVRGKAILIRRFFGCNLTDLNGGLNMNPAAWGNMAGKKTVGYKKFDIDRSADTAAAGSVCLQDCYSLDVFDKWYVSAKPLIDRGRHKGEIMLNFLSCTGRLFPVLTAKPVNRLLMGYNLRALSGGGIIIFDFADADLAERIYRENKKRIDKSYSVNNAGFSPVKESRFANYVSAVCNFCFKNLG